MLRFKALEHPHVEVTEKTGANPSLGCREEKAESLMCIIRMRYVSDPANFWDGICENSSHSPSFLGSTSSVGSFCSASFHLANLVPKWYVRGSPISCENKHDISSQKEVLYGSLPIYMLLSLQTRFSLELHALWGFP